MATDTPDLPSPLSITLYSGSTLPVPLRHALSEMINAAYDKQDRSSLGPELFPVPRIIAQDQLASELGEHGRIAVAVDANGEPVACAAVKPWKGRLAEITAGTVPSAALVGTGYVASAWELAIAASSAAPLHRGKGYCVQCQEQVIAYLLELRAQAVQDGRKLGSEPMSVWITALEGVGNMEYWARRGFVRMGEAEEVPTGTWGSTRAFRVGTGRRLFE